MTILNEKLVKQQKVTHEAQEQLLLEYEHLYKLLSENCPLDGIQLINAIEQQECTLQALWNFPQDRRFHSYWYRAYDCTCPVMDNDELMGRPERLFNINCTLHGDKNNER